MLAGSASRHTKALLYLEDNCLPTFFATLRLWLGLCLLTLSPFTLTAEPAVIDARIQALSEQQNPAAEQELQRWQESKALIVQTQQLEQQLAALAERQRNSGTHIKQLEENLATETYAEPELSQLSVDEQKAGLAKAYDAFNALQDELQQTSTAFSSSQTLPERNQRRIADTLQQLESARTELATLDSKDTDTAEHHYWHANIDFHTAHLNLLRAELQNNPAEQRRLNLKEQWLSAQVNHAKRAIAAREAQLASSQESELGHLLLGSNNAVWQQLAASSPALSKQLARNRQYAERLNTINKAQQTLQQEQLTLQEQLKRSRQMVQSLQEQIHALRGSLLLSQLLYQQQQQQPKAKHPAFDDTQLSDWRIEQFQLSEQRASQTSTAEKAKQLLASENHHDDAITDALVGSLTLGRQLVDTLSDALADTLNLAINNRIVYQQLQSAVKQHQGLITEQLFWMPSSRPMDRYWWQQLPQKAMGTLTALSEHALHNAAMAGLRQQWPWLLVGAAIIILLRRQKKRWQEELAYLHRQVGYVRYDHQWHTPKATLLSLLNTAPLPLAIGLSAVLWLPTQAHTYNSLLFTLTWQYALALWLLLSAKAILQPDGLGGKHFRWPEERCLRLREKTTPLSLLLLPILWSIQLGLHYPSSVMSNPFAPLLLVLAGLALAWLLRRPLTQKHTAQERIAVLPLLGSLALVSLPLSVAAASILGYHYTAITLAQRLLFTLLALWGCFLIYHLGLRILTVSARQLAYERAVLRRQYRAEKDSDDDTDVSAKEDALMLDIFRLNEQSLRLVRWIMLLAFAVLLYFIWADLIGTLSYLDHITLWRYQDDGGATLGNALSALLILSVSIVLARNLPSLLAVTLLSRLALKPGGTYTITALLTYVLTSAGIVAALASVGISWNKLQWLVAALGFGLGFGLQEIFANFVSGIILLFERPIRVGDYVTIGNYTGTVTRIRMRATTVRDSNRCEVILPNKAFVTDRFVNWTLTDTITRIVVKVGFAYDTDLTLAKQLLIQAAEGNPRVLRDPAANAFFVSMGASTLDYELRMYVKTLADRSRAIDELNHSIIERARALQIDIAFNQLEVTLTNSSGDEVALPSTNASTDPVKQAEKQ